MRYRFPLCLLVAFLIAGAAGPALAQSEEEDVEAAKQAAKEWLALLDADEYEATWSEAAGLFKSQVTAEQWAMQVQQAHRQLDTLQSRSPVAARYTASLPNAPDGEYVIAQYRATYGDENTIETVTLTKDQDAWRVAGYYIQPENQ